MGMIADRADYLVVGAGSAGSIIAERLSANGRFTVLLLEAGGSHRDLFVAMPKGMAKTIGNPDRVWSYRTEPYDDVPAEPWFRGKLLGGSSAINGMMYFRGQRRDYDDWAESGAPGWDGREMARVFREMEDHSLGGGEGRGDAGPLGITVHADGDSLSEAFIAAGEAMGVPRVADLNNPEMEGVGYAAATIRGGRRMSTAHAFLDPARTRANLGVVTGVTIDRILFEGRRAVAVVGRVGGGERRFTANAEIVICSGALASPAILERSGVGDAASLNALGIPVVAHRPQVGEHLLEHRALMMYYELAEQLSENRQYRGGRLLANILRYLVTHKGPMARAPYPAAAFFKTLPGLDRPDAQLILAPFVQEILGGKLTTEQKPSFHVFPYACRPRSRGSVHIRSTNPYEVPKVSPRYLADPYDREVTLRAYRFTQAWMRQPVIARHVTLERSPAATLETDDEILAAFRSMGQATFHTCGSCRMGSEEEGVIDEKCRVHGVSHLRIADTSIMPTMPSCNTNGPAMGVGWRSAELILAGTNA